MKMKRIMLVGAALLAVANAHEPVMLALQGNVIEKRTTSTHLTEIVLENNVVKTNGRVQVTDMIVTFNANNSDEADAVIRVGSRLSVVGTVQAQDDKLSRQRHNIKAREFSIIDLAIGQKPGHELADIYPTGVVKSIRKLNKNVVEVLLAHTADMNTLVETPPAVTYYSLRLRGRLAASFEADVKVGNTISTNGSLSSRWTSDNADNRSNHLINVTGYNVSNPDNTAN